MRSIKVSDNTWKQLILIKSETNQTMDEIISSLIKTANRKDVSEMLLKTQKIKIEKGGVK